MTVPDGGLGNHYFGAVAICQPTSPWQKEVPIQHWHGGISHTTSAKMETPICQLAVLEVSWFFFCMLWLQGRHRIDMKPHIYWPPRWNTLLLKCYMEAPLSSGLRLARQSPCQRWRNKICHCVLPAHAAASSAGPC